jgi:hypothetical protein
VTRAVAAACSGVCRVAACEEDAAVSLLEAAARMVDVAAACSGCVGACRVREVRRRAGGVVNCFILGDCVEVELLGASR